MNNSPDRRPSQF